METDTDIQVNQVKWIKSPMPLNSYREKNNIKLHNVSHQAH